MVETIIAAPFEGFLRYRFAARNGHAVMRYVTDRVFIDASVLAGVRASLASDLPRTNVLALSENSYD
jgi:predicted helicase